MPAQTLEAVEELQAEVAALEASLTAATQKVEEDERRIREITRRLDELAVGRFAQDGMAETEAVGLEEEQLALERDIAIARGAAESYRASLAGAEERLAEAKKAAARARYEELQASTAEVKEKAVEAARALRDAHAELRRIHTSLMQQAGVFEDNPHRLSSLQLYSAWSEIQPKLRSTLRGLF